jgi:hypothetical protein
LEISRLKSRGPHAAQHVAAGRLPGGELRGPQRSEEGLAGRARPVPWQTWLHEASVPVRSCLLELEESWNFAGGPKGGSCLIVPIELRCLHMHCSYRGTVCQKIALWYYLFSRELNLDLLRLRSVEKHGSLSLGALMRRSFLDQTEFRRTGHGLAYVIDLQAKVMQPRTVLRKPGLQGMFGRERLDQLEMRVA